MTREAIVDHVRRLAADVAVLDAYDRARAERPFDMTGGRRGSALRRLEAELRRARHRASDVAGYELDDEEVAPRPEDVEASYRRLIAPRARRRDATTAVIDAVLDVARMLNLEVTLDPNPEPYITGGSRSRNYRRGRRAAR